MVIKLKLIPEAVNTLNGSSDTAGFSQGVILRSHLGDEGSIFNKLPGGGVTTVGPR